MGKTVVKTAGGIGMSHVTLEHYSEIKPHRMRRIIWAGINQLVYPLLPAWGRVSLLRLFGAKIGKSLVYRSVKIFAPWKLEIGDWACIGPRVEIYNKAKVIVGNNSVLSQDSYVCTASHDISSRRMALSVKPIVICDGVWLAARAMVLPGVTLGEGAVVGAGAVVTKTVEPWVVVGGNPARVIKKRCLGN